MNRRDFIITAAALGATSLLPSVPAWAAGRRVRLGLIGTGMRGQVLLKELVRRDDVEVVALCDIEPIMLRPRAEHGRQGRPARSRRPTAQGGDMRRLSPDAGASAVSDGVVIATPWELARADGDRRRCRRKRRGGLRSGRRHHPRTTIGRCWRTQQTHRHALHAAGKRVLSPRRAGGAAAWSVQGLFGEMVHLQGGYQHDLRAVKFNTGDPERAYRRRRRVRRQGLVGSALAHRALGPAQRRAVPEPRHRPLRDGTPTSTAATASPASAAFASKARGLHDYIVEKQAGPDRIRARQGQVQARRPRHHPRSPARTARPSCSSTTPRCRARIRSASACRAPTGCGWTSTTRSTSKASSQAARVGASAEAWLGRNTTTRCGSKHSPTPQPAPATAAWTTSSSTPSSKRSRPMAPMPIDIYDAVDLERDHAARRSSPSHRATRPWNSPTSPAGKWKNAQADLRVRRDLLIDADRHANAASDVKRRLVTVTCCRHACLEEALLPP